MGVLFNPNSTGGVDAALATGTVRAVSLLPSEYSARPSYRKTQDVTVYDANVEGRLDVRFDDAGTTIWETGEFPPP